MAKNNLIDAARALIQHEGSLREGHTCDGQCRPWGRLVAALDEAEKEELDEHGR